MSEPDDVGAVEVPDAVRKPSGVFISESSDGFCYFSPADGKNLGKVPDFGEWEGEKAKHRGVRDACSEIGKMYGIEYLRVRELESQLTQHSAQVEELRKQIELSACLVESYEKERLQSTRLSAEDVAKIEVALIDSQRLYSLGERNQEASWDATFEQMAKEIEAKIDAAISIISKLKEPGS